MLTAQVAQVPRQVAMFPTVLKLVLHSILCIHHVIIIL